MNTEIDSTTGTILNISNTWVMILPIIAPFSRNTIFKEDNDGPCERCPFFRNGCRDIFGIDCDRIVGHSSRLVKI